jgi:Na+/H+-dicarboxylate symporter
MEADALILLVNFLIAFSSSAVLLCVLSFSILKMRSDATSGDVLSALQPTLSIAMASGEHSSVGIPQMVDTMSVRLGFTKDKVEFLVPLATCFVRSVPIMYFAMATVFIAQIYGHTITSGEFLLILGLSIVQGFASMGLQGANKLALLAVICNPLGLPTEAVILLLLAVEPICAFLSGLTMSMSQCAYVALISNKPIRL